MASDVADLRALLASLDLPLRFEAPDTVVSGGSEISALGFFVSTHAPGFVAAVNALPGLLDRMERAEARVRELEAIIAGRTTPPTDAEICAHDARGGAWIVTLPPRAQVRMMPETRYTSDPAEISRLWWSEGAWWVPVLHGRPCAWPTAEVSRG